MISWLQCEWQRAMSKIDNDQKWVQAKCDWRESCVETKREWQNLKAQASHDWENVNAKNGIAQAKYDQKMSEANALPWNMIFNFMGCLLAIPAGIVGLIVIFPFGVLGGAFIGIVAGILFLYAPIRVISYLWPEPFAVLARKLGYA
jgi:hypothetical protein